MSMFLSIIVVSYEMGRELPRTLYSLSPLFQQGMTSEDYEVIVVDNGSRRPPSADEFADLGLDLTVLHVEGPTHSPARAVNLGLDRSCGAAMGVCIDGARIASPGLLRRAREALELHPRAVVGSRGRYLGPMMQRRSMRYGYDRAVEDRMLESIDWQHNGYGLFSISVFDEVSAPVWHGQVGESNSLFLRRELWCELQGYDEAFGSPGGGFVNIDAWERACHLPDAMPILLLGEATFHQYHGGAATNVHRREVKTFRDEYTAIRGKKHRRPNVPTSFWGSFVHKPPPEELVPDKSITPADRMVSGPMKGLIVWNDGKTGGRLRRTLRPRVKALARRWWRALPGAVRRPIRRIRARS
jgi:glycosyltransferase involved in cell wall biosynthesis